MSRTLALALALALSSVACGGAVAIDGSGGAGGAAADPCVDADPITHTLIMSVDERPSSPALAAAVLAWQESSPGLQFRMRLNEPGQAPNVRKTSGRTELRDGVLHVNDAEPCVQARLVLLVGQMLAAAGHAPALECAPALTAADAQCFLGSGA